VDKLWRRVVTIVEGECMRADCNNYHKRLCFLGVELFLNSESSSLSSGMNEWWKVKG